tara:strand:+ start:2991 stop:3206 length:216 start_codon:yes stop_codon:yes gene_type:complete
MELKKLAEARVRYNQLSKKPISTKDLLFMELPQDKLQNISEGDYIKMIDDLSTDEDINSYLNNKYQGILPL